MPATLMDSILHAGLFADPETAAAFDDEATIRAMLQVEAALASAQGAIGMIPPDAAREIRDRALALTLAPATLASAAARDGVPVPALVKALRAACPSDVAPFVHWGATSQDIVDTGLALRLKPILDLWQGRLQAILQRCAALAERHADLEMAGRTYGQVAAPTTFGAVVAAWGQPLLRQRVRLEEVGRDLCAVSLGGAVGTLAAMGPSGAEVRRRLAADLGLIDPGSSWHAQRDRVAGLAAWTAILAGSIGKIAGDMILLAQSGVGEIAFASAGGSSTMPQKQNPVGPSALLALARHAMGLAPLLQQAQIHARERDGAAWFGEWLALPPLCVATGAALSLAGRCLDDLAPVPARMAANLAEDGGGAYAEAVSFALATAMPRIEAQALARDLAERAAAAAGDVRDLARQAVPRVDWATHLDASHRVGDSPIAATTFAASVRGEGQGGH